MSRTLMFVVNVDWFFLSHRLPIALEALRQGYRVHVAAGLTDKREELQRYGFVVHQLKLDRGNAGLASACHTAFELWSLFRAVRPDVVHLVTIKPVLLGGLMARLAQVPAVVAAVSGLGFLFVAKGAKAMVRRFFVARLYRLALNHRNQKVIFQNPDDFARLAEFVRFPEGKVEMIRGSGVDLTHFRYTALPLGVPVVLLAARLLIDKGVRDFVQAARLLRQQGVLARFCLAGSVDLPNPTSLLDSELALWASEGVVELWGQRTDMQRAIESAYLVVLPSYREGLPKVLLEAAASGRAVVTTDAPGCRDAIEPGVTGVLVPVCNAEALADAIRGLLNDPIRCAAMGHAGRALAERAFAVQLVVSNHMRIYQEIAGES
jgi:glycosyltransferase involved in cell wall biosynthesis